MEDIYENAENVMAWLDDQGSRSLGLQWLQAQYNDMKTDLRAMG